MEPLLQPSSRKVPAASWLLMGTTSWTYEWGAEPLNATPSPPPVGPPPDPPISHLPVFGDGVPDADLAGVAGGNQLVAHEEQSFQRDAQVEDACR